MKTIYDHLKEYSESDYYGFHMPGHKRNKAILKNDLPYEIDITEIDGFDDLHHAEEIIRDAERRAARLYHADETHFLVNGSTVGILSAILGTVSKGDKVLVARNCHKSVYNALFLQEIQPVYIYPEYDEKTGLNREISPQKIERILGSDDTIKAVVIVSPTYDGVVSDVDQIADMAHRYGIPLIVDEAHGAHFGFHPYFPKNANMKGADLVIHSVHKTLPSLTQTALLHMNGSLVNRERVRMYLRMLQSSSPSYVLMAGIDECMEILERQNEDIFSHYVDNLQKIRGKLGKLQCLEVVYMENYDLSKIIISTKGINMNGRQLKEKLRDEYHLQMEMAAGDYVLAMTAIGDSEQGLERLADACLKIDKELAVTTEKIVGKSDEYKEVITGKLPHAEFVCKSSEVLSDISGKGGELIPLEESRGKIAMEYAYLYPPGIPIIVPGERISEEVIKYLTVRETLGFSIEGPEKKEYIKVRRKYE